MTSQPHESSRAGDDSRLMIFPAYEAVKAENERLRRLIGDLYVNRGGNRFELYTAIKRAFREAHDGVNPSIDHDLGGPTA